MANALKLSEVRSVAATGDTCGEGAVWCAAENAVYWTDINRFLIHRWESVSGAVTTWKFSLPVTALTLTTTPGTLLAVLGSGVIFWRPADDWRSAPMYSLPEWPEARCNDARADRSGRLWIASMQNNVAADGRDLPVDKDLGRFFSVDGDRVERTWKRGIKIGNTVAWSPQGDFLYTADSLRNEIYRFRCEDDGMLSDEKLWFSGHPRGLPDGSTVDAEGYLWNCRYGGACLLRIAPDGSVDREIEMPVPNPTTCTYGGPQGNILYITAAAAGGPAENGGLFAIETSVRGLPEGRFRPD